MKEWWNHELKQESQALEMINYVVSEVQMEYLGQEIR